MSIKLLLSEISSGWVKAKKELFTGHPIAILLRQNLIEAIKSELGNQSSNYLIKSSAGAGNWADVPWLSILNPSITKSTQSGIYPVYLFRADGTGVYLSLGFGTTELKKKYGAVEARARAQELRKSIRSVDSRLNHWYDPIELRSNTQLGKSYEWASAGAKFYSVDSMPTDSNLLADLKELLEIYADVQFKMKKTIDTNNKEFTKSQSLPKPFLLLAGISGTGKSRFVRKQAEATSNGKANFELVSVRPDWHEPSDLLGYVSRLGKDGAEYVVTPVLKFMVKAWLDIIDTADAQSWTPKSFEQISPFWLCLDEMNLAPVEQYFADYLSVIETRDWQEGEYRCDPLLKKDVFEQLTQAALVKLQVELGLAGHDALWQYFLTNGIGIPFNLIVAGTVNMDETTHGFSRKVIDRALSFDFGEFFPNDVEEFFEAKHQPKAFSYPIHSQARLAMFASVTADSDAVKTKAFFNAINKVLKNTPFELAYRAFNELCLSVISFAPKNEFELAAVFDDFLMCKVLPRIEGDDDKLLGGQEQNLLEQLEAVLAVQLTDIWQGTRPDLLREVIKQPAQVIPVACRSKGKLTRMKQLLESGFTSFWP
jgi:hypothetical protein